VLITTLSGVVAVAAGGSTWGAPSGPPLRTPD
jgi:hypothetical protein